MLALLALALPPRPARLPGRAPSPATWVRRPLEVADGAQAVLVSGLGACVVDRAEGGGQCLAFFAAPGPAAPAPQAAAGGPPGGAAAPSPAAPDVRCPPPTPGVRLVGAAASGPLLLSPDGGRLWAWGWGRGPLWSWSPARGRVEWALPAADGGVLVLVRGGAPAADGQPPDLLCALAPDGSKLWSREFCESIPVLAAALPGGRAAVVLVQAGPEGLGSELWFLGSDGVVCGRAAFGPPPPHLLALGPDDRLLAVSEDRWRSYSWPGSLQREGPVPGLAGAAVAGPKGRLAVAVAAKGRARLVLAGQGAGPRVLGLAETGAPLALGFWGPELVVAGREGLALVSASGERGALARLGPRQAARAWVAGDLALVDLGGGHMELFRAAPGGDGR